MGLSIHRLLLPVLRVLRHRMAGRAVAVPDRDQLDGDADKRRGFGNGY
jgi:hypothetical protein